MNSRFDPTVESVNASELVDPTGSRTHSGLGRRARDGSIEISAPAGIVSHDPDDLVVTVLAGTKVSEFSDAIGLQKQFVPLDPRSDQATVGGVIASGLSGVRRLGFGPLRDNLLEVRFVTGYGKLVKVGGPTVKNVTGFDIPRLLVGSLGTLGLIVQATFRCRPLPSESRWFTTSSEPGGALQKMFRPTAILSDSRSTYVLLSGEAVDVATSCRLLASCTETADVQLPEGPHRGRMSVAPATLASVEMQLRATKASDLRWLIEWGVGTIHLAADSSTSIALARAIAVDAGGWLLIEDGAEDLDPFGVTIPNLAIMSRLKRAFDPDEKFARGRFG